MATSLIDERTRTAGRRALVVVASLIAWGAIAYGFPFHPVRIQAYAAVPPYGCPGQSITPLVDQIYHPPPRWLGDVTEIKIITHLRDPSTGWGTPEETFDVDLSIVKKGRSKVPSQALRTSPDRPGNYIIVTKVYSKGEVLGVERSDIEPHISEQVYEALPADSPRCVNG